MSACIFFASDAPLPEVFPPPEYDYLAINVDDGTIDDGGADDNFALRTYPDSFLYTDKAFAVCLDWAYYTEGRARQLIDYIGSCPRIRALRGGSGTSGRAASTRSMNAPSFTALLCDSMNSSRTICASSAKLTSGTTRRQTGYHFTA